MPKTSDMHVKIASTGMYLPDNVYSNDDVIERIKGVIGDVNDSRFQHLSADKITANTGIKQRYYADLTREENPETALFMGTAALQQALRKAGWDALDLDFIIFATVSVGNNPGDFLIPSVACHLQQDIGAYNAMAYDLKAACSGWLYGMSQAIVNIESGFAQKGAVVCAETQERGLDFSDPATCVLIGDLAVATLVEKSGKTNIKFMRTEANNARNLKNIIRLNDANVYGDKDALDRPFFRLNGSRVYKEGIRHMSALVKETLSETGNTVEDIDHFIFHQANGAMLKRVAKMTGIPEHKNLMNIAEVGNTTSATIPSVLHMYIENGTIKRREKILFTAFGGGVTSGTILMEF